MPSLFRTLVVVLAFVVCAGVAVPSEACGQSKQTALSLTRDTTFASNRLSPPQAAELDPSEYRRPRRARFLIAAGVGMLVSAAVHVGWVYPIRECDYDEKLNASLYGAGIVGGIGVSFMIGGGTWLGLSPGRHKHPVSPGQIVAASALALGAALGTQALLGTMYIVQGVRRCST